MFQYRPANSGAPMYAPERDILNLFPRICMLSVNNLHTSLLHQAVRTLAEHTGLSNQDLVDAADALKHFFNAANENIPLHDKLNVVWDNAGFSSVKAAALLALFFQIGVGSITFYFDYLRQAHAANRSVPGADHVSNLIDEVGRALMTDDPAERRRRLTDAKES